MHPSASLRLSETVLSVRSRYEVLPSSAGSCISHDVYLSCSSERLTRCTSSTRPRETLQTLMGTQRGLQVRMCAHGRAYSH